MVKYHRCETDITRSNIASQLSIEREIINFKECLELNLKKSYPE